MPTSRHPWLFALVFVTGCSAGSSDDPGPGTDSGSPTDASGSHDTGADAAKDSGHDAGHDATTGTDASTDAASDTGAHDAADGATTDASDAGRDAGSVDAANEAGDGGATSDASDDGATSDANDSGTPIDADTDAASDASSDAGAVVPPGAVGIWTFDENTGTTAADSSGMGHTATLVGGATWAPGKSGSALSLDGATGFADLGAPIVDLTASFTVACWVKFNVVPGWQTAISQEGSVLSVFTLKKRDDNAKFDIDFPGQDINDPNIWTVAQSTTAPGVSTWYHVTGIYDATALKVRVFVNGALEDTQPTAVILPAAGHTIVGRGKWQGQSTSYLSGVIDEVRVYARALTESEVTSLYDATK